MKSVRVARRYAEAFMAIAEEQKVLEAVAADLAGIDATLKGSRDLRRLLTSPVVREGQKKAVFRALWGTHVNPITMAFLVLLSHKQREGVLPVIIEEFRALHDRNLGVVGADVRTAVPLSAAQERDLNAQLMHSTGKTVRLRTSVDAALKGGLVVRIGDTVVDASVRHQLERLRERFLEGGVPTNPTA